MILEADAPTLFAEPTSWAAFSPDRRYRYLLGRRWAPGPRVMFVMLNPSAADASDDDPTIRRCVRFAAAAGGGSLEVVNLFALRSPNPHHLAAVADPTGPENDTAIADAAAPARTPLAATVCAWGDAGPRRLVRARVAEVVGLLDGRPLSCLGTTANGSPRHPLFLPAAAQLAAWAPPVKGSRP